MFSLRRALEFELASGAEITKVRSPHPAMDIFHIVQLTKNDEKNVLGGLGVDRSLRRAHIKSIVEYFERKAFFEEGIPRGFRSTNGIAGHSFKFLAKRKAKSELIERDALLRHWYTQTPFQTLEPPASFQGSLISLERDGLAARFGMTHLGLSEVVVCFLVNQNGGGFCLGMDAYGSLEHRFEKAFSEALVNWFLGDEGKAKEDLLPANGEPLNSLAHHRAYWKYQMQLPLWTFANGEKSKGQYKLSGARFTLHILAKRPIWVVGITSPNLLNLDLGGISERNLKILRQMDINFSLGENVGIHPIP